MCLVWSRIFGGGRLCLRIWVVVWFVRFRRMVVSLLLWWVGMGLCGLLLNYLWVWILCLVLCCRVWEICWCVIWRFC